MSIIFPLHQVFSNLRIARIQIICTQLRRFTCSFLKDCPKKEGIHNVNRLAGHVPMVCRSESTNCALAVVVPGCLKVWAICLNFPAAIEVRSVRWREDSCVVRSTFSSLFSTAYKSQWHCFWTASRVQNTARNRIADITVL